MWVNQTEHDHGLVLKGLNSSANTVELGLLPLAHSVSMAVDTLFQLME